MPVTEARRAAKLIIKINVEMSRLTAVAPLALNIVLTDTLSIFCVTTWTGKYWLLKT